MKSISSAVVSYGTTVTLQPRRFSARTMPSLMPQSTATIVCVWLLVREYQRFLQLTRETLSRGSSAAARRSSAASTLTSGEVISAFWLPSPRISRVRRRVSTPEMPGMPYSHISSSSVFV